MLVVLNLGPLQLFRWRRSDAPTTPLSPIHHFSFFAISFYDAFKFFGQIFGHLATPHDSAHYCTDPAFPTLFLVGRGVREQWLTVFLNINYLVFWGQRGVLTKRDGLNSLPLGEKSGFTIWLPLFQHCSLENIYILKYFGLRFSWFIRLCAYNKYMPDFFTSNPNVILLLTLLCFFYRHFLPNFLMHAIAVLILLSAFVKTCNTHKYKLPVQVHY